MRECSQLYIQSTTAVLRASTRCQQLVHTSCIITVRSMSIHHVSLQLQLSPFNSTGQKTSLTIPQNDRQASILARSHEITQFFSTRVGSLYTRKSGFKGLNNVNVPRRWSLQQSCVQSQSRDLQVFINNSTQHAKKQEKHAD